MNTIVTSPACPVCRDSRTERRFAVGEGAYWECGTCRSGFIHPIWSAEEAIAGHQGNLYLNKDAKKLKRNARRIKYLMRFCKGGKFLDIGCNGGFMVEIARRNGFETWGIDIDAVSVEYARGKFPGSRFLIGPVQEWEPEAPRFDLIHCSEVIEHVPDPHVMMAAIAKLLKPGAHAFITTPDLGHWRRPRNLVDWDGFDPPDHCIYFRETGLVRLAAEYGLQKVHRRLCLKPGLQVMFRKG